MRNFPAMYYLFITFFTIFILTIAAAETSIGLSLLLVSYRVRGNILIDNFNLLYF